MGDINISGQYKINGVPIGGGGTVLEGDNYLFVNANTGSATANGQAVLDAYNQAIAMNPFGLAKSATNRVTIYLSAGVYDFSLINPQGVLFVYKNYIDLVSLSGEMDVNFSKIYVQEEILNNGLDVRIVGIDVTQNGTQNIPFFVISSGGGVENIKIKNCRGGDFSFGAWSSAFIGEYDNCIALEYSFLSVPIFSPTAWDFNWSYVTPTGINSVSNYGVIKNCHAHSFSFAYCSEGIVGSASFNFGTFLNCTAQDGGQFCFVYSGNNSLNGGIIENCNANGVTKAIVVANATDNLGYAENQGKITNCIVGTQGFVWSLHSFLTQAARNSGIISNCLCNGNSFVLNESINQGLNQGTLTRNISFGSGFCGDLGYNMGVISYCSISNSGFCFFNLVNNVGLISYCFTQFGSLDTFTTPNTNTYYLCRATNATLDY